MTVLRRRTVTFGLAAAVAMPPRLAWAENTKVTFVLTNDIYRMGETPMADGKRRGGFARLAAVVKAERAKGGHVIFAHGGDTLSPSLMSGIDQGAHIIALTNALKPDIFEFHREALQKVSALPGMRSAAFVWGLPLTGNSWQAPLEIEGRPPPASPPPDTWTNSPETPELRPSMCS